MEASSRASGPISETPPDPPRGGASDSPPPGPVPSGSPAGGDAAGHDTFAERPELYVGAAFAGGLLLAGVLKWVAR